MQVEAFATTGAVSFVSESGNANDGASTLQPGSLTPPEDNDLLVSGDGDFATAIATVDLSFITPDTGYAGVGGVTFGGQMGYLIETTAAAKNPTWTLNLSAGIAVSLAVFKEGAGGGGGPTVHALSALGVGN